MLPLSKTLSQSLSIMFETVIVVGNTQFPSPKGSKRGLSFSTSLVLNNSFKVIWTVWKGE